MDGAAEAGALQATGWKSQGKHVALRLPAQCFMCLLMPGYLSSGTVLCPPISAVVLVCLLVGAFRRGYLAGSGIR